jgi:methylthioribose-1-phosphate isomerase
LSLPAVETLRWEGGVEGTLHLLDQTLLPGEVRFLACHDAQSLWDALRRLQVRGAPAIGVAAGYGIVLGARAEGPRDASSAAASAERAAAYLETARPTAVNLAWAARRVARAARSAASRSPGAPAVLEATLSEARAIHREDQESCSAIGRYGAPLIPDGGGVLTHCNAGALATTGIGTALGVLYAASDAGKLFEVFADETRPLWQGARLTAWELSQAGIPVTVLCDNMAPSLLRSGRVGCCVVGADRIAANGDTANKIGTYGVALAARAHRVPFYVAAPVSTIDSSCPDGTAIPIESRAPEEVTRPFGIEAAPKGVGVYNPAFDVTPADLIDAIVTDRGVLRPPYAESIARALAGRPA